MSFYVHITKHDLYVATEVSGISEPYIWNHLTENIDKILLKRRKNTVSRAFQRTKFLLDTKLRIKYRFYIDDHISVRVNIIRPGLKLTLSDKDIANIVMNADLMKELMK